MLRFRLNTGMGINLTNFSFKPFFKKLQFESIIKICKYILLEKQIIFFSNESE